MASPQQLLVGKQLQLLAQDIRVCRQQLHQQREQGHIPKAGHVLEGWPLCHLTHQLTLSTTAPATWAVAGSAAQGRCDTQRVSAERRSAGLHHKVDSYVSACASCLHVVGAC